MARPLVRRGGSIVVSMLTLIGCGRSELLWWADSQAEDTTVGDGDPSGDGDGDSTSDDDPWSDTDTTGDDDPSTTDDTTSDDDPTDDEDTTTSDDETEDGPCEEIVVDLSPEPATVIVLVDRGSHMSNNFSGGLSRLEAIRVALLDPMQGVAWAWESERRLGLVGFSSFNGNFGGECPVLEVVPPAVFSAVDMDASFSTWQAQDENPVADALAATVPLFGGGPGHVILVTGRNPDTCAQPNPQLGGNAAVAAAQDAFAAGVSTHLVAVGQLNNSYAQSLANAGVGLQGNVSWSAPANLGALRTAFDSLLASMSTCELSMDIAVDADACKVELDGQAVPLDDWSLTGPQALTFAGAACDAYLAGATPSMVCSCS